jgi:hypothetical protein
MKKYFLDYLKRIGFGKINSRQFAIACIIWIFPLGTFWLGLYLFWLRSKTQENIHTQEIQQS